ncbi:MAG: TIGR03435 family protein [Acidobacteriia bacterium]|nr:TIGR03435 family protein [Terriglobia bacterium]
MKTLLPLLALAGLCGAAGLKVGGPAPPIALNQVLQAPAGTNATWQGLKGTAVVLEFWATWCGGCRDQIPHLNRLAEQYQGKPVRFISVTDEEPGIVQRFLKDYSMSGWIGIDSAGQTFRNYEINGRPQTALVDAAGILRGMGNPADLTGEIMENFLAGKPIVFSNDAPTTFTKLQTLPDPLFQTMVRPAAPVDAVGYSSGAVSGKAGQRWETWGVPLRRLLSDAYGIPEQRIEAPSWANHDAYDVAVAAPGLTPERQIELLQRALQDTFQVKAHKESRDTAGYVLERRPGVDPKLRPTASGTASHWGKFGDITAVSVPVLALASVAERALGKPVFDETALQGRFDYELKWDVANPQAFLEAIREQLGLNLVEARRPLDYLVVDSAVQPRPW